MPTFPITGVDEGFAVTDSAIPIATWAAVTLAPLFDAMRISSVLVRVAAKASSVMTNKSISAVISAAPSCRNACAVMVMYL